MGNTEKKNKVLVIGVDGATLDIINPLIAKGQLPHIASLMKRGSWGKLRSIIPTVSAAAWTSFMTGMNPGKHGIYDFTGRVPGSYRFKFNNASDRRTKPLWSILGEAGKKVCVVGVTMTYPPDQVNGYMVSGLGTPPGPDCRLTEPADLKAELEKKFGKFQVVPEVNYRVMQNSKTERKKFVDKVFQATKQRADVFKYLWGKDDFDFGMIFFLDTDGTSHYFWKYMDKNHPGYDSREAAGFEEVVFDVYKKVDEAIGELLAGLDEGCNVIMISDHGFGPLKRVLFLNNWLHRKGYLHFKSKYSLRGVKSILSKVKRRPLPDLIEMVDWTKTRAFFNGTVGNIFINLKGRDPEGVVEPGKEYQALCDRLVKELNELEDPDNGEKIVSEVYRQADLFRDDTRGTAPDLTVDMKPGYGIIGQDIVLQGLKNKGEVIADSANWSGDHVLEGVVIASGPGFKSGREVTGSRLIDIAPTVLYRLGVPVPQAMDGEVLREMIEDDFWSANQVAVSQGEETKENGTAEIEYSEEESRQIAERLQDLGYLD